MNLQVLNELLALRYDFDTCDEPLKSQARDKYRALLGRLSSGSQYSSEQIAEAMAPSYREYCRAQRKQERRRQP